MARKVTSGVTDALAADLSRLIGQEMPVWLAATMAAALGVGEVRRATPLVPEGTAADIAAAAENTPAPEGAHG